MAGCRAIAIAGLVRERSGTRHLPIFIRASVSRDWFRAQGLQHANARGLALDVIVPVDPIIKHFTIDEKASHRRYANTFGSIGGNVKDLHPIASHVRRFDACIDVRSASGAHDQGGCGQISHYHDRLVSLPTASGFAFSSHFEPHGPILQKRRKHGQGVQKHMQNQRRV